MKNLKTIILVGFLSSLASIMVACSDNEDKSEPKKEASGDHIWKHQTDALQTSKDVAKKLQESLNQQQKKLDESN